MQTGETDDGGTDYVCWPCTANVSWIRAIFQFHLCRHPEHPKHVVQIAVIRHTSLHADTQHVRVVI